MINLIDYIKDNNFYEDIIVSEGIDIDTINKKVKLTNIHNKGVDFNNIQHDVIDNINIYSIFKRTKLNTKPERDGNPFIYALKEKNGWTFDVSDNEAKEYFKKFITNCNKLNNHYDVIIMCPSSSKVNEKFINILSKIINADKVINLFHKVTIEQADESLNRKDLEKYCKENNISFTVAYSDIEDAYKKMKNDNEFEAKYIPKQYLKFFKEIVDTTNDYDIFDIYKMIYNKDVLVLDDIISSGTTLLNTVDVIKSYGANKIDCVTLLSKL